MQAAIATRCCVVLADAATGDLDTANQSAPSTFSRKSRDEKGRRCSIT